MTEEIRKLTTWSLIFLSITVLLYVTSDIMAPFLIAFILAYMLHPAAEFCSSKFSLSRNKSIFIIFMAFLGLFAALVTLITPIIYSQISLFVGKIPQYKSNVSQAISFWSARLELFDPDISEKISNYLQDAVENMLNGFSSFLEHIWHYTMATINFFTVCVLVPFVLFYFLRDWNEIVRCFESLLPVKKQGQVKQLAISINQLLSAYIRGQLNICLLLSVYYVIGFSLIGIDFSLLLGLGAGFLVLIPFIGAIISYLVVLFSCYVSFGVGNEMIYLTLIFVISHILEGYFLTPRIIGNRIGLHPVWVVFAVLCSADLFGLIGIFFALPVAGIIRIIFLHVVDYYKASSLYND